jgi:hypothetical protein
MATKSIEIMLSRPGIYVIVSPVVVMLVEVDTEQRCFQLRLDDYSRDSELRPGGWILNQIGSILGPFARVA